jgi:hypothetical protein
MDLSSFHAVIWRAMFKMSRKSSRYENKSQKLEAPARCLGGERL